MHEDKAEYLLEDLLVYPSKVIMFNIKQFSLIAQDNNNKAITFLQYCELLPFAYYAASLPNLSNVFE